MCFLFEQVDIRLKYLSRTFIHITHSFPFKIDNEIGRHISLTFLSRFLCLVVIHTLDIYELCYIYEI